MSKSESRSMRYGQQVTIGYALMQRLKKHHEEEVKRVGYRFHFREYVTTMIEAGLKAANKE